MIGSDEKEHTYEEIKAQCDEIINLLKGLLSGKGSATLRGKLSNNKDGLHIHCDIGKFTYSISVFYSAVYFKIDTVVGWVMRKYICLYPKKSYSAFFYNDDTDNSSEDFTITFGSTYEGLIIKKLITDTCNTLNVLASMLLLNKGVGLHD